MRRSFLQGVTAGAVATLLLTLTAMGVTMARGITVTVDAQAVGERVEMAVRRLVAAEFPELVHSAREQLPGLVAARVAHYLTRGQLDVGPVPVELPPDLQRELQVRLTRALTDAGETYLTGLEREQVAARAGREARQLVQRWLLARPDGQRFRFWVGPGSAGLAVPVTLRVR